MGKDPKAVVPLYNDLFGADMMMLNRNLLCLLVWGLLLLSLPAATVADEFAGKWQGRWTTDSQDGRRGHQGTLRMSLRPQADGSYQGTFAGRFAVVIPYVYRARVERVGQTLVSSKRLGPFGNYTMHLSPWNSELRGHWSAGSETGGIRLRRRQ